MKSPEELAAMGLERVPWDSHDIRWDAIYTWNVDDYEWYRVTMLNHNTQKIAFGTAKGQDVAMFIDCMKHSLDNGQTWHPCTKVQTIGGAKPDFNKVSVGGEQINKNAIT